MRRARQPPIIEHKYDRDFNGPTGVRHLVLLPYVETTSSSLLGAGQSCLARTFLQVSHFSQNLLRLDFDAIPALADGVACLELQSTVEHGEQQGIN